MPSDSPTGGNVARLANANVSAVLLHFLLSQFRMFVDNIVLENRAE